MDVERVLNQIRERVVAEPAARTDQASLSAAVHSNGSATLTNRDEAQQRLRTHLAIAGRAADRLPPLISNRHGTRARLELWIKSKSKPLTRWFTWEQVNFNRAVNDALADIVEILKSEAQELAQLKAQLTLEMQQVSAARAEVHEIQANQQLFGSAIEARLEQIAVGLTNQRDTALANHARLEAEFHNLLAEHTKLADQVIELAAVLRAESREIKSEQDAEIGRRLSQLAADLKEEQRVCFRQVSLEIGESAVLEDRARRSLLARVEQLEQALQAGRR